jgi:hypothetical protein
MVQEVMEEHQIYEHAKSWENKSQWESIMVDEIYDSLLENDMWKFYAFPLDMKVINNKWVYRPKLKLDNSIDCFNLSVELWQKGVSKHME